MCRPSSARGWCDTMINRLRAGRWGNRGGNEPPQQALRVREVFERRMRDVAVAAIGQELVLGEDEIGGVGDAEIRAAVADEQRAPRVASRHFAFAGARR